MELEKELLRRMRIAAHLFQWSGYHIDGFLIGMHEALANPEILNGKHQEFDESDMERLHFADRETALSAEDLRLLGRYEAWNAVQSWRRPDERVTAQAASQQAKFWWDMEVCGCAKEDADIEVNEHFDVSQLLGIQSRELWIEWLIAENSYHLADGMVGYASLVLEKHCSPKFIVQSGESDVPTILDGWHRFAADIAVGTPSAVAVVIRPKPSLELDGFGLKL